ncbi:helix-turn-helix domain-containing protein [Pseudolabrys sp. FHR47]|uniref:helix-turn-helix domain-containing protein n=1 Tax=Pseudolabrys sp. FHR47 TaxID=2562284 RepID=UPI001FEDA33B|nr:XRE family transcriptional regulator [Pseudolabrys sp. FHR47]
MPRQLNRSSVTRISQAREAPRFDRPAAQDAASLDKAIGARLKTLRISAGLSLDELSKRANVSKAMLSRIERAESSATANLLGRICSALGVTLSSIIALGESGPGRIVCRADQPVWRDPETGYKRRHASPPGAPSGIEIIVVDLPAETRVPYSPWGETAYSQQLLMLSGKIRLWIDDTPHILSEGDSADFDVQRPLVFENSFEAPAQYVLFIRQR